MEKELDEARNIKLLILVLDIKGTWKKNDIV